jgi:tetratricopeptide (TPR) repeat protein
LQQKPPVVREWTWKLAIPQFVVQGLLIAASVLLFWPTYGFLAISFGALIYLLYSYGSRFLLLRHHRSGRAFTDRGDYPKAIEAFKQSYRFFSSHVWMDEYRSLTMMTPVRQTFREMALVNIAFCYVQLGDVQQAKAHYQRALEEFPSSTMAQLGLDTLQTLEE